MGRYLKLVPETLFLLRLAVTGKQKAAGRQVKPRTFRRRGGKDDLEKCNEDIGRMHWCQWWRIS